MEVSDIFQKLGFSQIEIIIYLANLEIGISPVSNIAKKANIKRTTLYANLEKMAEKGILLKHSKNGIVYFEAISPDELYKKLLGEIKNLEIKLPELRAINNKNISKPKIYFFEGVENVAKLYEKEVQDNPSEVKVFSSNLDRKSGENDVLRKLRNKIYSSGRKSYLKIILNRELYDSEKSWTKLEGKHIPQEKLNLETSIKIYQNKVQFISKKEGFYGILIENSEIARTMEQIFDYIYYDKR